MLEDIDFLAVVRDRNGPFVLCELCLQVVGVDPHSSSRTNPKNHPIDGCHTSVYRHLRDKHAAKSHRHVTNRIKARPDLVAALWNGQKEYPIGLVDGSDQDPRLPLYEVYECHVCHCRKESVRWMRRHIAEKHKRDEYTHRGYDLIPAQTWFPNIPGGMGVWWRVEILPGQRCFDNVPTHPRRPDLHDLLSEGAVGGTKLRDDVNPFLQRTGWRETFEERPY